MNNKKREKIIDKLLCYMKQYAENKGLTIKCIWFDFEPNKAEDVLYNDCRQENNSDEYFDILKLCNITPEELKEILNYCHTNDYVICCQNFKQVQLSEKGSARATSVMNKKFTLPTWFSKFIEIVVAPHDCCNYFICNNYNYNEKDGRIVWKIKPLK